MAKAITLLLLLVTASLASAQAKLNVSLDTPLVKLGGRVTLVIEVDGTLDAELTAPPETVDGLIFGRIQGPSTVHRSALSNGRLVTRQTATWTMTIRPTQTGEFQLAPVTVLVDGKAMTSPDQPMKLRVIEDTVGAERGFLDVDMPSVVYEGAPFDVVVTVGFDQDLGIERHALFLPWWHAHGSILPVELDPLLRGRSAIRVNDRFDVSAEPLSPMERDGAVMRPHRMNTRFLATRAGTYEYGAGTYEFREVVARRGFTEEYRSYYAVGPSHTLEVKPVPEEGRPLEWSGAVGPIEANRRIDRRVLREGETLQLTVSWTGDANLGYFHPPDLSLLEEFQGFRVVGTTDDRFADERRVRYDLLAADPDVLEVPPIPLWTFNTDTKEYEVVETRPVPIRVEPVEDDMVGFEAAAEADVRDIADLQTTPFNGTDSEGPGGKTLLALGISLPLLWYFGRREMRRRRGDPDAPMARRRRVAERRLRVELSKASRASDQAGALAAFLAARTGEEEGAWVGRDFAVWAEETAASVDEALLTELVEVARDLDERAWAESDEPLAADRITAVASRLAKGGLA